MTLVQDPCFLLCFLCDAFSFLLFFSCFLGVLRANLGHLRQQPDTGKEQRNPSEIQGTGGRDQGSQGGPRGRSSSLSEAPTKQSPGGATAPKPHHLDPGAAPTPLHISPHTQKPPNRICYALHDCTPLPPAPQRVGANAAQSGLSQAPRLPTPPAAPPRGQPDPRHGAISTAVLGKGGERGRSGQAAQRDAGRVLAAQARAGPRRARGSLHPALGAGALGEGSQNKDDVSSDLGCEKQGGTGRWRLPALPSAAPAPPRRCLCFERCSRCR